MPKERAGVKRARGVVAEEHHLAGDGIDLRMRGEGAGDARRS